MSQHAPRATPDSGLILKKYFAKLPEMKLSFSILPPVTPLKSCLFAFAACALLGCGDSEELVEQAEVVIEETASDGPPPPPQGDSSEGMVSLEERANRLVPDTNAFVAAPTADMSGNAGMSFIETLKSKADEGDIKSAYLLGYKYTTGEGLEKNPKEGAKWLKFAANRNNAKAQALLGRLYEDGVGVSQNSPLAYAWYLIAARQDDPDAIERIGILGEKLNDQDLEEADRLAADFVSQ